MKGAVVCLLIVTWAAPARAEMGVAGTEVSAGETGPDHERASFVVGSVHARARKDWVELAIVVPFAHASARVFVGEVLGNVMLSLRVADDEAGECGTTRRRVGVDVALPSAPDTATATVASGYDVALGKTRFGIGVTTLGLTAEHRAVSAWTDVTVAVGGRMYFGTDLDTAVDEIRDVQAWIRLRPAVRVLPRDWADVRVHGELVINTVPGWKTTIHGDLSAGVGARFGRVFVAWSARHLATVGHELETVPGLAHQVEAEVAF